MQGKIYLPGLLALGLLAGAASAATVTVQLAYYSSFTKPFFQKMAKEFEAAHPSVHIQIQEANWNNLHQVLLTDLSGNQAPDLSIIGTRWLPEFVSSKVVEPLSGLSSSFLNQFIPAFLKPSTLQGTLYGLPWAASDRALIYNKGLFAKAGIQSPPKTWAQLEQDAAKLSKLPGVYGFGLQGGQIETDVYYYYALWGAGGNLLTPQGTSGLGTPAALKALNFYMTLIKKGLTEPNVTGVSREDLRTLFVQGRLGMFIYLPPIIGYMKTHAPNIHYGISAIPALSRPSTYAVTDTIAMFKPSVTGASAADVAASKQFLEFLYQTKNRVAYNKGEGFLPVEKAVAADPFFKNNPRLNAFVKLLPTARFAPVIPQWSQISNLTINMLQSVYLGKEIPAQALKATAQKIDKLLGK